MTASDVVGVTHALMLDDIRLDSALLLHVPPTRFGLVNQPALHHLSVVKLNLYPPFTMPWPSQVSDNTSVLMPMPYPPLDPGVLLAGWRRARAMRERAATGRGT